ncbi:MAG: PfkB family carbohydrate kinase, partial [Bauldia sp.]
MITVFGSINVDLVTRVERPPGPSETVRGSDYRLIPGGKGANQALAARRAGAEVRLFGAVGDDSMAAITLTELTAAGGPFAMTEIEVRGNPMRVFDSAPPTMRSLWELATFHGDKTYVVYEDERYTYAEIAARVRALAGLLRDVHGVGVGDRVAVAMRNYPEWVVGYWAT